jgi:hypothetical protein
LSKKSKDFFDKKAALRSAPHLPAFGGQFDARYAIGILVHAHVAPRMIELCFAAAAAKICDAFFDRLKRKSAYALFRFRLSMEVHGLLGQKREKSAVDAAG